MDTSSSDIGTIIDYTTRGLRVLWEDGEETLEKMDDLDEVGPLMGWEAQTSLPETLTTAPDIDLTKGGR